MRRAFGLFAAVLLCAWLPLPAAGASGEPVRPGMAFSKESGGRCTLAFLLRGRDGWVYAATAGHCLPVARATVWKAQRGPTIQVNGRTVGRAAYSVFSAIDRDFALIRLNRGVAYNPSVCGWGGPRQVQRAARALPVVARHYGAGELPRLVSEARVGVFPSIPQARYVRFFGVADDGDSGGPVLDDNLDAVGVLTTINPDVDGLIGVNRLAPSLVDAERALGTRLTLLSGATAGDCA